MNTTKVKFCSFGKQTLVRFEVLLIWFQTWLSCNLSPSLSIFSAFLKSTTIYRTGLDTSEQALLTSHPPFLLRGDLEQCYSCTYACAYFRQIPTSVISMSASTRKRKMFLFLVLISPQCTLAFSSAYAYAYHTSVNQALKLMCYINSSASIEPVSSKWHQILVFLVAKNPPILSLLYR